MIESLSDDYEDQTNRSDERWRHYRLGLSRFVRKIHADALRMPLPGLQALPDCPEMLPADAINALTLLQSTALGAVSSEVRRVPRNKPNDDSAAKISTPTADDAIPPDKQMSVAEQAEALGIKVACPTRRRQQLDDAFREGGMDGFPVRTQRGKNNAKIAHRDDITRLATWLKGKSRNEAEIAEAQLRGHAQNRRQLYRCSKCGDVSAIGKGKCRRDGCDGTWKPN
jgi:hypothetical protein